MVKEGMLNYVVQYKKLHCNHRKYLLHHHVSSPSAPSPHPPMLKVASLNTNGLGDFVKRKAIAQLTQKFDIILQAITLHSTHVDFGVELVKVAVVLRCRCCRQRLALGVQASLGRNRSD